MPHHIGILVQNIGLPICDVGALGGLLLKRELPAGVDGRSAPGEHKVSGQQQFDAGHHADIGVGIQDAPQLRRGKIIVPGNHAGQQLQLLLVVPRVHLDIAGQIVCLFIEALKAPLLFHLIYAAHCAEGGHQDQDDQDTCHRQGVAPPYFVSSFALFLALTA